MRSIALAVTGLCGAARSAWSQSIPLTGDLGAHDPSNIYYDGSSYYYFTDGIGIISRSSTNLTSWTTGSPIFTTASIPSWTYTAAPTYGGDFWAPDIAYFNGLYHVYYAVSEFGTINSGIGEVTTPSLTNPTWTDQGKVVESNSPANGNTDTTAYNAIDPSIMVDSTTGKVWMSFGSYSSGIVVMQLDPNTGKMLNPISSATLVANNAPGGGWGSSIEASYLMQHGGYYYLFVNYGECCAGVDSTYNIRVGRSTSPTGPFYDLNGVNMTNGGGSMFLQDNGNEIGPGQFGYLSTSAQDYFSYHYYDGNQNGAPQLGLNKLYWINGWPSAAPVNSNWAGAAGASWSLTSNWSAAGRVGAVVPNAVDNTANFGANAAGGYSVSLTAPQTVTTLNFTGASGYTIGNNGGYGLTMVADSGEAATINVADDATHTIAAPITAQANLEVNVKNGDSTLVLSGAVSGLALEKYGFGTVALGGSSSFNGTVLVHQGTLDITGAVTAAQFTSLGEIVGDSGTMTLHSSGNFIANGDLNVGDTGDSATPASGTLNISDTAAVTGGASGGLYVGSGFSANTNAVGTVNQSGGTLTANGNFDGAFVVGGRTSSLAVGTYNLSGGTVNANTNVRIGGYGAGTLNQTGGTFNATGYISIGRFAGATGSLNLSGGVLNQTGTPGQLIIGEAGAGTFTDSGSGLANLLNPLQLGRDAGSVGVVNLNGGIIIAPRVTRGAGSGTFNFNGGVLEAASGASTTFMSGLTAANIRNGGAIIDTHGQAITIGQALNHSSISGDAAIDGGLIVESIATPGTLILSGNNTYTGLTTLQSGTLQLDANAQATVLANAGADVRGGSLIFDYNGGTDPIGLIKTDLTTSHNAAAGPFTSGQIHSSTAVANKYGLGYADNTAKSQVTVMYTLYGDSDLDGDVSIADFNALASHFGTSSGANWSQGDFDYDGSVSIADFNLLATNFGDALVNGQVVTGGEVNYAPLMAFAEAHNDLAGFEAAISGNSVPEPGALSLVGVGMLALRRRWRKPTARQAG